MLMRTLIFNIGFLLFFEMLRFRVLLNSEILESLYSICSG